MMWSPPQVGRNRAAQINLSLLLVAVLIGLSGCASFAGLPNASGLAAAGRPGGDSAVPLFDTPRVAVARPVSGMIAAPRPFAWKAEGQSAGRRSFRTASIGTGDYRVLVVGSVGGDDPIAIALVDQLTRTLHADSVILGGFQTDVIRTLNPDGAATGSKLNALGEYINHGFPRTGEPSNSAGAGRPAIPEAQFLLNLVDDRHPDRVIHIRTVAGSKGLIGYSRETREAGIEAAEWLGFRSLDLAAHAVPGSLERHFAESVECGVLVFGIPQSSDKTTVWKTYGDALLNLMLEDDLASRDLARRRRNSESADRRNRELDRP
jgi:hypothetical protein